MISTRRISQSIRRWSYLGALAFVASLAVAACGGKVVVDGGGNGDGGAGGTTQSSAAVSPTTGSSTQSVCDAAVAHLMTCPGVGTVGPIPPCEGQALCIFTCVLNVSCEGLLGIDQVASQQFATCTTACG
ncbi:MAG: hypothetical protein ABJE95_35980 [Byssovorax sp.]